MYLPGNDYTDKKALRKEDLAKPPGTAVFDHCGFHVNWTATKDSEGRITETEIVPPGGTTLDYFPGE